MFSDIDWIRLVYIVAPLLFAVTVHEVAHGAVAYRLGDPTAKMAGRLTLNPIRHLDLVGSFLIPFALFLSGSPFLFGYAKPVPVNFARLPRLQRDMIWVSSAGVLANLILAIASAAVFRLLILSQSLWIDTIADPILTILVNMAAFSVVINCVLAIFNLIPIPPLDGARIVFALLPARLKRPYARVERYGMILIFLLLITHSLSRFTSFFIFPLVELLIGA